MKASEFIALIQNAIEKHGDEEIHLHQDGFVCVPDRIQHTKYEPKEPLLDPDTGENLSSGGYYEPERGTKTTLLIW